MEMKRINQPTVQRYLTPTLIVLLILTLLTFIVSMPTWALWSLLALAIVCLFWLIWIVVVAHRTEYKNLVATIILFMVINRLVGELNPPPWWNSFRFVALILLAVWGIWFTTKEWRRDMKIKRQYNAKQGHK